MDTSELSQNLGELAFLITDKNISTKDKTEVVTILYDIIQDCSEVIAVRIKNFFEIVCTIDGYLLHLITRKLKTKEPKSCFSKCIISSSIILCRIKRGNVRIAEREVEFLPENYNAYYELSMFFYYKRNYTKSLYYISKSISISPDYLRVFFENKRKEIVDKMEL